MNAKKIITAALSMIVTCLIMPTDKVLDNTAFAKTEIWDGTYDTSWYDEEETELHISTAEELAGLSELINAGQKMWEQTIYLDNDIYLNDVSDYDNWGAKSPANKWTPISSLSGTLDGNGHTIYGMYLYESQSYANTRSENVFTGFCRICKGEICNLNMDNTYIEVTQSGYISVGINYSDYDVCGVGDICGYCMYGNIHNCVVSGNIDITLKPYSTSSSDYIVSSVGGIAGKNTGGIEQCASYMNINAEIKHDFYCKGKLFVGGICGSGGNSIEQCKNAGTINCLARNSNDITFVGGICGYNSKDCYINFCYNEGDLGGSTTGGIVGGNYENLSIRYSYNVGANFSGDYLSGGVAGLQWHGVGIDNTYYLDTTAIKAIGYSDYDNGAKSAAEMQEKEFAQKLTDSFVYNEGGYPLLAWEAELQQEPLAGDVNLNGVFDVADIKLLQNYLVCRETLTAEQGAVADVCNDGVLNALDLCVLRRMYLEQSKTAQ
ncbi:dockerin type I repeat-containing protein [uncultured Ruminococcus sp.]|uniref:dockerin type I repeat-containing protein n=1 Tax=uncultured Ruminococcus sp. TaxID=165186 RepID=UPI00265F0723|nr:dockerin type I repeat-containing protein [uncultured Ruminococcus sp.]